MRFLKLICLFFIGVIFQNEVKGQFYINNGAFKFIAGIGLPVDVEMPGGSLSWFTNLQVFYKVPDNITYYEPYKVLAKRSLKNTFNRYTFYRALENFFHRLGYSGSECLHQLICKITKRKLTHGVNGLFEKVTNILFSPEGDYQISLRKYKKAQWQGLYNNSDCSLIYQDCWLEENSPFLNM